MQIKTVAWIVLLVLAGCAGTPGQRGTPDADLQRLLGEAAERVQVRDLEGALALYQQALPLTEDPFAARQAAQLASALEDWPAVIAAAERWQALAPDSASAAQLAVIAELRRGVIEAAVARFRADLLAAPDDNESWQTAVAVFAAGESADVSRAALAALLEATGPHPEGFARLQQSRMAWQLGERETALELAGEAVAGRETYPALVWQARLARELAFPELALQALRRASALRPEARQAALAESELLREMGRDAEALEVLAGLEEDAEVLYTIGALQFELGQTARAGATWQRLASWQPEIPATRHAWLTGLLAEVIGMDAEAAAWYARVDDESRPRAELRRAVVLARLDRPAAAREALAAARRSGDEDTRVQAWLVEGQMLGEAGRLEAALDLYSDALTEVSSSVDLLYARAMTAVRAERLELAEQDLRAIIQRDPENAAALNALGYTLSDRTDRQREAVRLIERALALDPDNPAILDSMGWVLYKLGRPEAAVGYLERAAGAEAHPEIVAHLIEVLWKLDRRDEALNWVDRAPPEFGDDAVFAATLDRLGLE